MFLFLPFTHIKMFRQVNGVKSANTMFTIAISKRDTCLLQYMVKTKVKHQNLLLIIVNVPVTV